MSKCKVLSSWSVPFILTFFEIGFLLFLTFFHVKILRFRKLNIGSEIYSICYCALISHQGLILSDKRRQTKDSYGLSLDGIGTFCQGCCQVLCTLNIYLSFSICLHLRTLIIKILINNLFKVSVEELKWKADCPSPQPKYFNREPCLSFHSFWVQQLI